MSNYIQKPETIGKNIWYRASFPSLNALYNYLKSNPTINERVYKKRVSLDREEFYLGDPLENAIEYLKGGYYEEYEDFLHLKGELDSKVYFTPPPLAFKRTQAGSRIDTMAVLAGSHNFMIKPVSNKPDKFVNVYFNLAHSEKSSSTQIRNRGLITLNLIKLLESNNYNVKLEAFSLCYLKNEFEYIKLNLKEHGKKLNTELCYFPFVAKEFYRRIIFNVKETLPVENIEWERSYGLVLGYDEIKKTLNLGEKDILINLPLEMGIKGGLEKKDLIEDANSMFNVIGIDKYVKIKK